MEDGDPFRCRCGKLGEDRPCIQRADAEDMLCSGCREGGCGIQTRVYSLTWPEDDPDDIESASSLG